MQEPMILKYQSGEEIKKGDRVLYCHEPGEIELVVDQPTWMPQWIGIWTSSALA
jgi:hypothetical protein